MVCKGICSRHKAVRPRTGKRYLSGQRRCQNCAIFINWPGFYCPCCGYRLRNKPRNKRYRYQLILSTNIIKDKKRL